MQIPNTVDILGIGIKIAFYIVLSSDSKVGGPKWIL